MTTPAPLRVLMAIKSPLQAFNAVEFCMQLRDSGKTPELHAVVFCSPQNPAMARLVEVILGRAGCQRLDVVPNLPSGKKWWYSPREYKSAARFRRAVSGALSDSPSAALLLVGDYRSRECRHLAACMPASSKIVLLDDGSATHQIARFRNNPGDPSLAPMFPGKDFRTLRLRLLAGIRLPSINKATFFSHYPLGHLIHDTHQPHGYEFWRKMAAGRSRSPHSHVLFLGMSHVEKQLTTLPRYLAAMGKILAYYRGRDVLYRPHRDEIASKLEAVRALGFKVMASDATPVELVLIESETLPAEIGCIASSAIDNLAIIFQGTLTVRCFIPETDYCSPAMNGHFQDIIRHHAKGGPSNIHTTELIDCPSA